MTLDPNQRISRLSLEKRALLEAHLLRLQERKSSSARVPRRGNGPTSQLSFGQERLWFLHNLEPQKSWYNAPHAFRLEGNLEVSAWKKRWRNLSDVSKCCGLATSRWMAVQSRS